MSDDLPLDSRGGAAFAYYAPHDGTLRDQRLPECQHEQRSRPAEGSPRQPARAAEGWTPYARDRRSESSSRWTRPCRRFDNTTDVIVLPAAPPSSLPLDFIVDGKRVGSTTVPSYHMSPRFSQANFLRDVVQIDVEGPFDATGAGDTPSRRKIFTCAPRRRVCRRAVREKDHRRARSPGLSQTRRRRGHRAAAGHLPLHTRNDRLQPRHRSLHRGAARRRRVSCSCTSAIPQAARRARSIRSAIWSLPPAWRYSCGAACRTRSSSMSPRRASCASPAYSRSRSHACWTIPGRAALTAELRRPVALSSQSRVSAAGRSHLPVSSTRACAAR